jgi:ABC-type thiamine transport system ATPase subunit
MLHSYTVRNFLSFGEDTEVSFRLTKHAPVNDLSATDTTGQRLTKAMAVIGPNGSGKTNLLKPLAFLGWFVSSSFQIDPKAKIFVQPHFFAADSVSEFQIEFDYEGRLWRYELAVTPDRVLSEALHVKTSRLFSYVFTRDWVETSQSYRIKQQGFGFNQSEAEKVRENASLISTAAQYQVPLASDFASLTLTTNVNYMGRQHFHDSDVFTASRFYASDEPALRQMSALLQSWDLGLADVTVEMLDVPNEKGEMQKVPLPFGMHRHGDRTARLPLFQESSGTQSAFVLLSRLLPVLRDGGLAVIDEFEADLHPHMLMPILDLFFSPETNPNNAQVIFTCHSVEVLNLLHKSQVTLVQKDEACGSEAWRLDSVRGVRNDDNLYAKYMAGAYGAIPDV